MVGNLSILNYTHIRLITQLKMCLSRYLHLVNPFSQLTLRPKSSPIRPKTVVARISLKIDFNTRTTPVIVNASP